MVSISDFVRRCVLCLSVEVVTVLTGPRFNSRPSRVKNPINKNSFYGVLSITQRLPHCLHLNGGEHFENR